MTEQKQQKRKARLLWQIFKWIGLSFLVLLLIAAIIYQAPWKIIILLAIILAACTVLPRPFRKWFWLSAGTVVIVLFVWILLPEDNEGWRPYTFDIEMAELEAKYAIPDEENAAIIYDQLMVRFDANDYDLGYSEPDIFNNTFNNPWLSKDYPEITDKLKHIKSSIETLKEISKIKLCFFPISDTWNNEQQNDRNSAIISWARMLVIAVNNDVAEGRINKAVEKILTNLQMAKHLYQQPATLDFLVGINVERLAIQQFNRLAMDDKITGNHVNIIEKALDEIRNDWNSVFNRIIEYDKLCNKTELIHFYEVNAKGRTRLSRDPWAQLRSNFSEFLQNTDIDDDQFRAQMEYIAYPSYFERKKIKAGTIFGWFIMPSNPEKAAEILDRCFQAYYAMAESDYDWTQQPYNLNSLITKKNLTRIRLNFEYYINLMITMHEESYYGVYSMYMKNLALRRGSRLLIAIKKYHTQHGTWPDGLNAIKSDVPAEAFKDPVSGNEFEYENHGKRFSLFGETINIWPK